MKLLQSYFRRYGVCRHQIEGYDSFITSILPSILRESCNVHVQTTADGVRYAHDVVVDGIQVVSPSHSESDGSQYSTMPFEAKARRLTYSLTVKVRFRHTETHGGEVKAINTHETQFCVPCMVGSKFCNLRLAGWHRKECAKDSGGYFIVNGHCKTLVAQQKLCINRIFVFPHSRWGLVAEVRSSNVQRWRSTSTLQMVVKNGEVCVFVPFVSKGTQPLAIPFDLCVKAVGGDEDAQAWIADQSGSRVRWAQCSEVLPHLGMDSSPETVGKKVLFLERMRARLLGGEVDDRDHQKNRRVDGAGPSLGILFRQIARAHIKTVSILCKRLVEAKKKNLNLTSAVKLRKLTSSLRYHFSTGNWSLMASVNQGVVQLLSNINAAARRSHLNRIAIPLSREGKSVKPRLIHPSSRGLICPCESPEGAGCGLALNKALLMHVTTEVRRGAVQSVLALLELKFPDRLRDIEGAPSPPLLSVTGDFVFEVVGCPHALAEEIRALKLVGSIPVYTGITVSRDGDLCLLMQPGRCTRPLLRAGEDPGDEWVAAVYSGKIEYLCKAEEAYLESRGLMGRYREVCKYAFVSDVVAAQPFIEHSQGPRIVYQASMAKQALGWPTTNIGCLTQTQFVLNYPQRSLVKNELEDIEGGVPSLISCIVGIATASGWNQVTY